MTDHQDTDALDVADKRVVPFTADDYAGRMDRAARAAAAAGLPDKFGVRIEDIVMVTPDGGRRLNNTSHELHTVQ